MAYSIFAEKQGSQSSYVRMDKIPGGTWFVGRFGQSAGLFFKAGGSVVFMGERMITWTDCEGIVAEYQEVDVEITYRKARTMSGAELQEVEGSLPNYYPPEPPKFP